MRLFPILVTKLSNYLINLVYVMGEMETNFYSSRKFVQTFFLAEQATGFYIYNDIFRFLKEDFDVNESFAATSPDAKSSPPTVDAPISPSASERVFDSFPMMSANVSAASQEPQFTRLGGTQEKKQAPVAAAPPHSKNIFPHRPATSSAATIAEKAANSAPPVYLDVPETIGLNHQVMEVMEVSNGTVESWAAASDHATAANSAAVKLGGDVNVVVGQTAAISTDGPISEDERSKIAAPTNDLSRPTSKPFLSAQNHPQQPRPVVSNGVHKANEKVSGKTWATLAESGKERWAGGQAGEVKVPVASAAPTDSQSFSNSPKTRVIASPEAAVSATAPSNQQQQQQPLPKTHEEHHATRMQRIHSPNQAVFIHGFTKSTKIIQLKEQFTRAFGMLRWVELLNDVWMCVEVLLIFHLGLSIN